MFLSGDFPPHSPIGASEGEWFCIFVLIAGCIFVVACMCYEFDRRLNALISTQRTLIFHYFRLDLANTFSAVGGSLFGLAIASLTLLEAAELTEALKVCLPPLPRPLFFSNVSGPSLERRAPTPRVVACARSLG